MGSTICRWAPEFQNDYQARMDWCVMEFDEANHPPKAVLNGDKTLQPIKINAKPGEQITLNAAGSNDLDDGDKLFYEWRFFPEAGSYMSKVKIENPNKIQASMVVPEDASGTTLHVLLVLRDSGIPQLTRYRRLVVECE